MSDTAIDNTKVSLVLQRYKQRLGIESGLDDVLLKAIFVRDQDPERMELINRLEWHGDRVANFAMSRLLFSRSRKLSELTSKALFPSNGVYALIGDSLGLREMFVATTPLDSFELTTQLKVPIRIGNRHILADTFEALMGAIDISLGAEKAVRYFTEVFTDVEPCIINFVEAHLRSTPLWSRGGRVYDHGPNLAPTLRALCRRQGIPQPRFSSTWVAQNQYTAVATAGATWQRNGRGTTREEAIGDAIRKLISALQQRPLP